MKIALKSCYGKVLRCFTIEWSVPLMTQQFLSVAHMSNVTGGLVGHCREYAALPRRNYQHLEFPMNICPLWNFHESTAERFHFLFDKQHFVNVWIFRSPNNKVTNCQLLSPASWLGGIASYPLWLHHGKLKQQGIHSLQGIHAPFEGDSWGAWHTELAMCRSLAIHTGTHLDRYPSLIYWLNHL